MSDLIISFVATAVFCLIMGGGFLLLKWLAGIFGSVIVIPIFFFVLLWIGVYLILKE